MTLFHFAILECLVDAAHVLQVIHNAACVGARLTFVYVLLVVEIAHVIIQLLPKRIKIWIARFLVVKDVFREKHLAAVVPRALGLAPGAHDIDASHLEVVTPLQSAT